MLCVNLQRMLYGTAMLVDPSTLLHQYGCREKLSASKTSRTYFGYLVEWLSVRTEPQNIHTTLFRILKDRDKPNSRWEYRKQGFLATVHVHWWDWHWTLNMRLTEHRTRNRKMVMPKITFICFTIKMMTTCYKLYVKKIY